MDLDVMIRAFDENLLAIRGLGRERSGRHRTGGADLPGPRGSVAEVRVDRTAERIDSRGTDDRREGVSGARHADRRKDRAHDRRLDRFREGAGGSRAARARSLRGAGAGRPAAHVHRDLRLALAGDARQLPADVERHGHLRRRQGRSGRQLRDQCVRDGDGERARRAGRLRAVHDRVLDQHVCHAQHAEPVLRLQQSVDRSVRRHPARLLPEQHPDLDVRRESVEVPTLSSAELSM